MDIDIYTICTNCFTNMTTTWDDIFDNEDNYSICELCYTKLSKNGTISIRNSMRNLSEHIPEINLINIECYICKTKMLIDGDSIGDIDIDNIKLLCWFCSNIKK